MFGKLPTSVEVQGVAYPVRTSFRIGVQFEELMADASVPEETKLALALNLYYPTTPPDIEGAVERILWFHRCGKPAVEEKPGPRLYSFEHDFPMLYAAFLAHYKINLYDPDLDLHWWAFRSMMGELPHESEFSRAVSIRAQKPSKDMTPEQRRDLAKMKRFYALPVSDEQKPISQLDLIREKFGEEAAQRWLASTR